jgi:hypothetical protein
MTVKALLALHSGFDDRSAVVVAAFCSIAAPG